MKTLGLVAAMFLGLAAAPAGASAHGGHGGGGGGWRGGGGGGGHVVVRGGGGGGWRGPGFSGPGIRVGVRPLSPVRGHVWVPGYWGNRAGARIWIGSGWYAPPYDGWIWVQPQWVWNGYQWVWQDGRWAAP
jgi:hypothetical protein